MSGVMRSDNKLYITVAMVSFVLKGTLISMSTWLKVYCFLIRERQVHAPVTKSDTFVTE